MPAIRQTRKISPTEGTCPVISEGWKKIAAPIMVPATIAVALGRSVTRLNLGVSIFLII